MQKRDKSKAIGWRGGGEWERNRCSPFAGQWTWNWIDPFLQYDAFCTQQICFSFSMSVCLSVFPSFYPYSIVLYLLVSSFVWKSARWWVSDMTPCNLVDSFKHFVWTSCLRPLPWSCRHQVTPKRGWLPNYIYSFLLSLLIFPSSFFPYIVPYYLFFVNVLLLHCPRTNRMIKDQLS
jgi:hypothetical protein